ncbi:hypothetical protein KC842_00345 [Candidatus Nomurabacteria bacterium]|nr:hypothetical protein [Candidatus Nomurabacteria bacterium]USN94826.1 MAG: hypothetical protein H6791_00110 [Candidatus Nomurabacteria bacterium]
MKKLIFALLISAVFTVFFTACNSNANLFFVDKSTTVSEERVQMTVTGIDKNIIGNLPKLHGYLGTSKNAKAFCLPDSYDDKLMAEYQQVIDAIEVGRRPIIEGIWDDPNHREIRYQKTLDLLNKD